MARQGTVAPTHFNVIWDQTGFVLRLCLILISQDKDVLVEIQIESGSYATIDTKVVPFILQVIHLFLFLLNGDDSFFLFSL